MLLYSYFYDRSNVSLHTIYEKRILLNNFKKMCIILDSMVPVPDLQFVLGLPSSVQSSLAALITHLKDFKLENILKDTR